MHKLPNNLTEQELKSFFESKPVRKVFLFGSYARGEANENSDLDLVVELDQSGISTGMEFFILWDEIEKLTGKKVDLVSRKGLAKKAVPNFEKEKILIYERAKA